MSLFVWVYDFMQLATFKLAKKYILIASDTILNFKILILGGIFSVFTVAKRFYSPAEVFP